MKFAPGILYLVNDKVTVAKEKAKDRIFGCMGNWPCYICESHPVVSPTVPRVA